MRNLRHGFYLVLVVVFIASCTNEKKEPQEVTHEFSTELYNVKGGWKFTVITYKGHEYIAPANGGIVHTESCKCKL